MWSPLAIPPVRPLQATEVMEIPTDRLWPDKAVDELYVPATPHEGDADMTEYNAAEFAERERQLIESARKLRNDTAVFRSELEEAIPHIADPRLRALAKAQHGLMLMTEDLADADLVFLGATDE